MQQEMNILGVIDNTLRDVDWKLVRLCKTEQEAMRLCINESRVDYDHRSLSLKLGYLNESSLSAVLNSDKRKRIRNMSRVRQIELQNLCTNRAIDQWAEMYAKGLLHCQQSDELQKLEAARERFDKRINELKAG